MPDPQPDPQPEQLPGWYPFDYQLYYPRKKILAHLTQWAGLGSRDRKRVLCLTGAPGSGKSWTLNALREHLKNDTSIYIFWIDALDLIEPTGNRPDFRRPRITDWIQKNYVAIEDRLGLGLRFDPDVSETQAITILCEQMHRHNEIGRVLVLVDGYDEISERQQDFLADRVLVPLIGGERVRMVITHRQSSGLRHDQLRMMQKRVSLEEVDPFVPERDTYPFLALISRGPDLHDIRFSENDFRRWTVQLKQYAWDHPYANRFLFEQALIGVCDGQLPPLKRGQIRDCVIDLIERPDPNIVSKKRYPPLTPADWDLLQKMACLEEAFTPDDISIVETGIEFFSDPRIERLMNIYGVLASIPGTLRYRLVAPIRALLCDLDSLEGAL